MSFTKKRAIVTGATGVLGAALVEELTANKIETVIIGHRNSIRNRSVCHSKYAELLECDLCDIDRLPGMLEKKEGFDVFYHLGWTGTADRNNVQEQEKNISYTLTALQAAKELGCRRFIGAGSQAEYGRYQGVISPDTPAYPETAYGMAKLCAGQMSKLLASQIGIEYVWTRTLSVYGPNDSMNTLVPTVIRKLLAGEKPACTPGEQIWDYLYASDAGRAMYLLGEASGQIVDGRIYVIGSGKGRPLLEYMYLIRDAIDHRLPLGIGEIAYSEKQIMYLQGDISDLVRDTGFCPQVSFDEGIRKTIDWIQSGGYHYGQEMKR